MVHAEIQEMRKEYGAVVAVEDISLTLEDGEFLVLLGPSGCGKSTTLRMLAGLEDVTSGENVVDGEVVNDQSPAERDFALVFQQVALYPHMSVFDNISSPLRAAGVDDATIEEQVTQTAELLDIEELVDRDPGELSGGQQQRVAIGRALVREPRAFLLDEPFSKLDQKLRIQLQKELKQLQEEMGITTVFVTHDQEEAMVLADRIMVMDEGRLQQVDTPENIYYRPTNRFVADFIGNPTMNFFNAAVRDETLYLDDIAYEEWDPPKSGPTIDSMAARPEDIGIVPANPDDNRLVAEVNLVEMRGSTAFLVCDLNSRELTVLKRGSEVTAGDRVALEFDFGAVNFFDEADGRIDFPEAEVQY
jgi:multiple sugar transport system ATP-binding protein